jgi:hypothetical protein
MKPTTPAEAMLEEQMRRVAIQGAKAMETVMPLTGELGYAILVADLHGHFSLLHTPTHENPESEEYIHDLLMAAARSVLTEPDRRLMRDFSDEDEGLPN